MYVRERHHRWWQYSEPTWEDQGDIRIGALAEDKKAETTRENTGSKLRGENPTQAKIHKIKKQAAAEL